MKTEEQLAVEIETLVKLLSDPAFQNQEMQTLIARIVNALTWVSDDTTTFQPVSEILQVHISF